MMKSFANDWQLASRPGLLQVVGVTLKKLFIGQHRQACCTARLITARNRRWLKWIPQNALAWAGLLDLGNHPGATRRGAPVQCPCKPTRIDCGGTGPLSVDCASSAIDAAEICRLAC